MKAIFSKDKEKFNNISFILLIFVGFLTFIFTNINIEHRILKEAALKMELETYKQADVYFADKDKNQENIFEFAEFLADVKFFALYDQE
jgi:hypothetical protein